MKLAKKFSDSDWLKLDDEVSVKVDYPTREQQKELDRIALSKFKEFNVNSFDELNDNQKVELILANQEYTELYLRYTIKDWRGLGEDCKVENNQLDAEQWGRLIRGTSREELTKLYELIYKELSFTDTDKKK